MNGKSLSEIVTLSWESLFQILLIIAASWVFIVVVKKTLPRLAERFSGSQRQYLLGSVQLIRLLVILIAVLLIIPRVVEPSFQNLFALLGGLGLALGFAFKDYASSLTAGLVAAYENPYRMGDWIEVDGTYGEVTAIGMRAVEIVTPDDTKVVIPHQKLWNSLVKNSNNGTSFLQCTADFYLHPEHSPRKIRQVLTDVAMTSPFLNLQRPVSVVVSETPWATHYRLKAYPADPRDQFQFVSDLTARAKPLLLQSGAQFAAVPPFAIRTG
ncbi:MAG: mechanosensitive ion channel family protein [Desulfobacterales bacterium]|nr:mechanosensitive ion channel family protein [Desulfobacterales bacterium]